MPIDSSKSRVYTFSGADARAYAYFDGFGEQLVWLDAMHTISASIHESKGDARALGFKGVKGFTRGIRMVAGSIIMVVINDNPFAPLTDLIPKIEASPFSNRLGWSFDRDLNGVGTALDSLDFTRRFASAIPPFNILVQYATEVNNWSLDITNEGNLLKKDLIVEGAAFLLSGIDIIDEGIVTSVNDAYTEVTYSFKALDCKPISMQEWKRRIAETELEVDPAVSATASLNEALYGSSYNWQVNYAMSVAENGGLPAPVPRTEEAIAQ